MNRRDAIKAALLGAVALPTAALTVPAVAKRMNPTHIVGYVVEWDHAGEGTIYPLAFRGYSPVADRALAQSLRRFLHRYYPGIETSLRPVYKKSIRLICQTNPKNYGTE